MALYSLLWKKKKKKKIIFAAQSISMDYYD